MTTGCQENAMVWAGLKRGKHTNPYSSEAEHLTLNQGAGISKFPGGTI